MAQTNVSTVAVVGAGQMGRGIAQVAAGAGCTVLLADALPGAAEASRSTIAKSLEKLVEKGKMQAGERETLLERIRPVAAVKDLASADVAIEAIVEDEAVKKKLFVELDGLLAPGALLASNTSSISITRLGTATKRPDKVIGMHFMNPVPVMKLVEVIRGNATSDATYAATCALAERLGKAVVTSQDYPGFIVNRILMPMINEAAFALMEGVATAKDLDQAMQLGTNQPMGPLTLADFIGLDTCLSILEVLHEGFGDPKYRPCPLLRQLVDAGRMGKKSGHGFHKYA
jgi:3-hydroxybutyryl-CoA dehydrogenase